MEVDMPFICTFCAGAFCAQHRLPESHNCSEYWRVRAHRQSLLTPVTPPDVRAYWGPRVISSRQWLRFSPSEVKHILIGLVLVSAVGLSFMLSFSSWIAVAAAVLFFTGGFIAHELMHKAVAQRYGLWAEFRLDTFGALLTVISAVSPLKIIAPGAVVIAGETTPERVGRTATAGPTTNIVIATLLFALAQILHPTVLLEAVLAGAAINAFMALFNTIPFGVLDGLKIFRWNKRVWLVLFALACAITGLSYLSL
jgi:Zn-dependent protease